MRSSIMPLKSNGIRTNPFQVWQPLLIREPLKRQGKNNFIVVLDGSGVDEQVGGYDYYYSQSGSLVQGMKGSPTRPLALVDDF